MNNSLIEWLAYQPYLIAIIFIGIGWSIGSLIIYILIAGDKSFIRDDLSRRKAQVIRIKWRPFGYDWPFEKNDRYYSVEYEDEKGHLHKAVCKYNNWAGAFWRDDQIIRYNQPREEYPEERQNLSPTEHRSREQVMAENEALREEIKKLNEKIIHLSQNR